MSAARTFGVLFLTLAAGCAGVTQAPSGVTAQAGPLSDEPTEVGRNAEAAVPAPRPPPETKEEARVPAAPAKAVLPSAKIPAKVSVPPAALALPRHSETPVPASGTLEASLDVAALTARLRDTSAIGVFSKLALKNQVDDLLKRFRAYHQGGQRTSVASLRQPYNMLLLKVLSLVQDSDPSLARAISGSREAIWSILADPENSNW